MGLWAIMRLCGCGPFELNIEKHSELAENDEFTFRHC